MSDVWWRMVKNDIATSPSRPWFQDVNRCRFVKHGETLECGRLRGEDVWPYGPCTEKNCQKKPLWFTAYPDDILNSFGIPADKKRAEEFENLIDGDLSGYYYVEAASGITRGSDEALKWIMGALAAYLNEKNLPFSAVYRIMPADYLETFVAYLREGKFEKGYAKDIFSALLSAKQHASLDIIDEMTPAEVDALVATDCWIRRRNGFEVMDEIIADPRFKAADSSEIDAIIETVLAANADKVAKVPEQPQLVQWFVGQVMKAARGKATGAVVLDKLKAKFG